METKIQNYICEITNNTEGEHVAITPSLIYVSLSLLQQLKIKII